MPNLCKCGCGLEVKPRNTFIKGHSERGKKRLDMVGENNPAKRPEVRQKISKQNIGNHYTLGRKRPEHSEWMKKNSPAKRPEVRNKINKSLKSKKVRKKISEQMRRSLFIKRLFGINTNENN